MSQSQTNDSRLAAPGGIPGHTTDCPRWPKWRRIARLAERLLAVIGLILAVYLTCFETTQIVSGSMSPTLQGDFNQESDWILTEKLTYRFRDPHRWELVAFDTRDFMHVMKRTVGLPGERLQLECSGVLRVNGSSVEQPSILKGIQYLCFGRLAEGKETTCGEGFFVLGDNSQDSQDSRFDGPVERSRIRGRPWMIIWPPSRIRFVNP